jgi:hypothetical protein
MRQTTRRNDLVLNARKSLKVQKSKIIKTSSEAKFKSNYLNSLRRLQIKRSVDTEGKNIPLHIKKNPTLLSRKKSNAKDNKRPMHMKVKSNVEANRVVYAI